MKERDMRLVNEMRKNSRRSLTAISMNIDMPLGTVFKAVNRLYKRQVIMKDTCLIDFAKVGFPLKLGVFIRTNAKDELKKSLEDHPNLNAFLRLSGDYDYYAEFLFKDMIAYKDLIDELNDSELVKKMSPHFITDVKHEEFRIGGTR
jgi:Lrp/AsnC family leucine-responsive transcriptional regulator